MSDLVINPVDRFSHNEAHITIGLSYPYHLIESIVIFGTSMVILLFIIHFSMKFLCSNSSSAASNLGLYCLPMSPKWVVRLTWG